MKKNQPPRSYTTFISKIDEALSKPVTQLTTLALESTSLSRVLIRNRTILKKIATELSSPLWSFVSKLAYLDELLAIDIFRSPHSDLYLSPTPPFKDIRSICCYHDDDMRVSLAIFSALRQNTAFNHTLFFTSLCKYLIEERPNTNDYIKDLSSAFKRTAVLNTKDALQTLSALSTSLALIHYKKSTLRLQHRSLTKLLEETTHAVEKRLRTLPPYLRLPSTLIARIRFEHAYQFGDDFAQYCAYAEAIYSEECIWAQLIEDEYQPVVLATMSYFEYYGRKTWVTRTLAQLKKDCHNESTCYDREQVINDVIDTLRELYLQGDPQAGIDYISLAGTAYFQSDSANLLYPINPIVAIYLLGLFKNSHRFSQLIKPYESKVLSLANCKQHTLEHSRKLLSEFVTNQTQDDSDTWDGRVFDIMKH